jgi:hypothetical protein
MAKYCPECRTDCGTDTCPTDAQGHCRTCGKPPVDASGRGRSWLWCKEHGQWHDTPCAEDANRHCCTTAA